MSTVQACQYIGQNMYLHANATNLCACVFFLFKSVEHIIFFSNPCLYTFGYPPLFLGKFDIF